MKITKKYSERKISLSQSQKSVPAKTTKTENANPRN